MVVRCASMPRPERCCRCVETRKYAMTCSIDHTAYHRLPRGRSEVQSNFVAVFVLQQALKLTARAADRRLQRIAAKVPGKIYVTYVPAGRSAQIAATPGMGFHRHFWRKWSFAEASRLGQSTSRTLGHNACSL